MAEHDIVGPQQGSCLDQLMIRAAAALGRPLQMRIRVNGFEPSSSMVEAGLGIALVSEHHASRCAASGRLVFAALDEPWAVRQWKICSRDPKALPAPARLLLDHLSARPQPREPVRIRPRPGAAPLAGFAPCSQSGARRARPYPLTAATDRVGRDWHMCADRSGDGEAMRREFRSRKRSHRLVSRFVKCCKVHHRHCMISAAEFAG